MTQPMEEAKTKLTEVALLLAKSLVDKEADVAVQARDVDTLVLFEVRVAPGDFGKLIGRYGANAKSLRLFIRAMGRKHGLDAYVKVIDPQGHEYRIPDPESPESESRTRGNGAKPPR